MAVQSEDSLAGLGLALTAYVMWGFLPLYMKAVVHITPVEVIAHRVLWSVPVAAAILLAMGRLGDLRGVFTSRRTLTMGAVTAALVSVNWGIYIWSIGAGRALDAALGYYINPLFSIFLGAVLLGEKLGRAQIVAILLAGAAVAVLTFDAGRLPLAALGLTFSWGFYAYFKRSLPIGPTQGFFLEVLLLLPIALGLLAWFGQSGQGHFVEGSARDTGLLLAAGLVTAVPLIIYAAGAKRLQLSTIGILQYIAPTMIFGMAVFVFDEPFGRAEMVAFPMIWAALAIYSVGLLYEARRRGHSAAEQADDPRKVELA